MSDQKHTEEPWAFAQDDTAEHGYCMGNICGKPKEEGKRWTPICRLASLSHEENVANKDRIVACVNALKGLNPSAVPGLVEKDKQLRELVDKQAEDDGLWFLAGTAPEQYLQNALRKLHEIIEGKTSEECAITALAAAKEGE